MKQNKNLSLIEVISMATGNMPGASVFTFLGSLRLNIYLTAHLPQSKLSTNE